jgi:hypothetical protein
MRITGRKLRQIIREEILRETTLDQVSNVASRDISPEDDENMIGNFRYTPDRKDVTSLRRDIKRAWNQHADHAFFQDPSKLLVIHKLGMYSGKAALDDYFPSRETNERLFRVAVEMGLLQDKRIVRDEFFDREDLFYDTVSKIPDERKRIPGIQVPSRNELSASAIPRTDDPDQKRREYYFTAGNGRPPRQLPERRSEPFFTFKKYRITWASQDDSHTEHLNMATPEEAEFYTASGFPKRPAVDVRLKFVPVDEADSPYLEEVVIDNWIIDVYHGNEEDEKLARALGLKFETIRGRREDENYRQ